MIKTYSFLFFLSGGSALLSAIMVVSTSISSEEAEAQLAAGSVEGPAPSSRKAISSLRGRCLPRRMKLRMFFNVNERLFSHIVTTFSLALVENLRLEEREGLTIL